MWSTYFTGRGICLRIAFPFLDLSRWQQVQVLQMENTHLASSCRMNC